MHQEKTKSTEQQELAQQIASITSMTESELMKYIPEIRKKGKEALIPHLIKRWNDTENDRMDALLYELMMDLKLPGAIDFLMEGVMNPDYARIRSRLLSAIWQSSLDASDYLTDLVKCACEGDYATAIEVLTIVDHLDAAFSEDELLDCTYALDEAMETAESNEFRELLAGIKDAVSKRYTL